MAILNPFETIVMTYMVHEARLNLVGLIVIAKYERTPLKVLGPCLHGFAGGESASLQCTDLLLPQPRASWMGGLLYDG